MHDARTICGYGPWSPTCGYEERCRQLRCLSAIAYMLLGPHNALWRTLRSAEADAKAFTDAYTLVETLPALVQRRLLSTHMAITWPRRMP